MNNSRFDDINTLVASHMNNCRFDDINTLGINLNKSDMLEIYLNNSRFDSINTLDETIIGIYEYLPRATVQRSEK